jgi:hypothetical protein
MSDLPHLNTARPSTKLPTDQELVLKVIPMPRDCNANGDIFGGWVMANIDLAGAVIPARYAAGRMATVAMNEMVFKHPVRVGDILSFFSKLPTPRSPKPRSPMWRLTRPDGHVKCRVRPCKGTKNPKSTFVSARP